MRKGILGERKNNNGSEIVPTLYFWRGKLRGLN